MRQTKKTERSPAEIRTRVYQSGCQFLASAFVGEMEEYFGFVC